MDIIACKTPYDTAFHRLSSFKKSANNKNKQKKCVYSFSHSTSVYGESPVSLWARPRSEWEILSISSDCVPSRRRSEGCGYGDREAKTLRSREISWKAGLSAPFKKQSAESYFSPPTK